MDTLVFYVQRRQDGGERTGVDWNEERLLHRFEPSDGEYNPALSWFVDVRFDREELPDDADEARAFLIDVAPKVGEHVARLAERVSLGVDDDLVPIRESFDLDDPAVRVSILASAVRRVTRRELGEVLRGVGGRMASLVGQMELAEAE